MAPPTRTHTPTRKGAKDSRRSRGKPATGPAPATLTCEQCGKTGIKSAAGLASHERSQHPPAVVDDRAEQVTAADADQTAPAERSVPVPPEGLGGPALSLWRQIVNVYDLRPDELRVLEDACGEAMLVDRLKRALDEPGTQLIVRGSMGQQVASPLLTEIRQHRGTLAQLLGRLNLPDDATGEVSGDSPAERSVKARAAANARWRRAPA